MNRILIISEDGHLALALQVALAEQGYFVRHESHSGDAIAAIKEFAPDTMITASPTTVFVSHRHSAEISELARPVDIGELLLAVQEELPRPLVPEPDEILP